MSPRRAAPLLWLRLVVEAAVFSPAMDAEISELHASIEELWQRLGNLAEEMQEAGKLKVEATGHPIVEEIRRLQEDFLQLQQQAYLIGEDSADNAALARHPLVHSYVEQLRVFHPRLKTSVNNLEKEYTGVMLKPIEERKEELRREKFCGVSLMTSRAKAKKRLARDTRNFKTKALDELTIFRERQLEMQDKQHDMLARMEGPDWPRLDWPLSNADARLLGNAEDVIHSGIDSLKNRLAPKDIPYLHESGDQEALEALVSVGDMMACYSKLMDRYVEKVKKSQKEKKKMREVEVRTSLLSFGKTEAPRLSLGAGGGLSGLASVGSSLGGLAAALEEEELVEVVDQWSAAQPVYNDHEL